jgi:hypothetical protein
MRGSPRARAFRCRTPIRLRPRTAPIPGDCAYGVQVRQAPQAPGCTRPQHVAATRGARNPVVCATCGLAIPPDGRAGRRPPRRLGCRRRWPCSGLSNAAGAALGPTKVVNNSPAASRISSRAVRPGRRCVVSRGRPARAIDMAIIVAHSSGIASAPRFLSHDRNAGHASVTWDAALVTPATPTAAARHENCQVTGRVLGSGR